MLSENIKHILDNTNPIFLYLNLYKNQITNTETKKLKQYATDVYTYKRVTVRVGVTTNINDVNTIDILLLNSNKSTKITDVIAIIKIDVTVEMLGIAIKLFNLSTKAIPHLPKVVSQTPGLKY